MAHVDLFIWRHAEADDTSPDLARALTAKGRRDASRVGRALARLVGDDTRIIASPAVRTRQTAAALVEPTKLTLGVEPRIAPGAPVDAAIATVETAIAAARGGTASIVVVGHQPWVGQLAHHFLTGRDGDWAFRKAAAWWLVRRERGGETEWTLKSVLDPDVV